MFSPVHRQPEGSPSREIRKFKARHSECLMPITPHSGGQCWKIATSSRPTWATKGDFVSRLEGNKGQGQADMDTKRQKASKQSPHSSSWQQGTTTRKPKSANVLGPPLASQETGID